MGFEVWRFTDAVSIPRRLYCCVCRLVAEDAVLSPLSLHPRAVRRMLEIQQSERHRAEEKGRDAGEAAKTDGREQDGDGDNGGKAVHRRVGARKGTQRGNEPGANERITESGRERARVGLDNEGDDEELVSCFNCSPRLESLQPAETIRAEVLALQARCRYAVGHETARERTRGGEADAATAAREVDRDSRRTEEQHTPDSGREREPMRRELEAGPASTQQAESASRAPNSEAGNGSRPTADANSNAVASGCGFVDTLSRVLVHERYCSYAPPYPRSCCNVTQGCPFRSASGPEMQQHEEACRFRTTLCPFGCGTWLPLHILPSHGRHCLRKVVTCLHVDAGCPVLLPKPEQAMHAEECGYAPATCYHVACRHQKPMTRREMRRHLAEAHQGNVAEETGAEAARYAETGAGTTSGAGAETGTQAGAESGAGTGAEGAVPLPWTQHARPKNGAAVDLARPSLCTPEQLRLELSMLNDALVAAEQDAEASLQLQQEALLKQGEQMTRRLVSQADLCMQILMMSPSSATGDEMAAVPPVELRALFHCACTQGSELLLEVLHHKYRLTADVVRCDSNLGLRLASQGGHAGALRLLFSLFELGVADARGQQNQALRLACQRGHLSVVRLLIEEVGLTVADVRADNCKPLRLACQNGNAHLVKYLIQHCQLTSDDVRADNNRALRVSCEYGHAHVVQLLAFTYKLNAEDARSCSCHALQLACQNGHYTVVRLLVEDFGMTREDVLGSSARALCWAAYRGHLRVLSYLMDRFQLRQCDLPPDSLQKPLMPEVRDYLSLLPV